MAAASKRFGHARGKKVVKEIRGGLPEQYSNKGFCWFFIGLFIVCVFFGILLCREGTGICETVIGIGFMYLVVLYIYLRFSVSYCGNGIGYYQGEQEKGAPPRFMLLKEKCCKTPSKI